MTTILTSDLTLRSRISRKESLLSTQIRRVIRDACLHFKRSSVVFILRLETCHRYYNGYSLKKEGIAISTEEDIPASIMVSKENIDDRAGQQHMYAFLCLSSLYTADR